MKNGSKQTDSSGPELQRHFGLLQATALNITMIVGAGVFVTIPLMLLKLPGPYALLGWLGAGFLMLVDGLIWSELGAALPGSGGSYLFLLESFGRQRWGRLMAFLFIWQFIISGPLEAASGLIAMAQFATALDPAFEQFNVKHTISWEILQWQGEPLAVSVSPARGGALLLGVLMLVLLYRRITILSKLTMTFWIGVLGIIAWILIEGGLRFDPATAFDFSQPPGVNTPGSPIDGAGSPINIPGVLMLALGGAMILAMYSYLGYYQICYIGDEVRDPGRTIPRSILLSSLAVCLLFTGLHLAMLGTVSWTEIPRDKPAIDNFNLPAHFMGKIHGGWAVKLVTVLLIWSCFGSVFAALLSYSRIPYGAARYGHFFSLLGKVHPRHRIPHVSLFLVGGLTLFWSLFDLGSVINALITTRILEQFIAQIAAVVLLRRYQPERLGRYRMWLYPLPCAVAFAGWLFLYVSAGVPFIVLGLATMILGLGAFFAWSWWTQGWPFGSKN